MLPAALVLLLAQPLPPTHPPLPPTPPAGPSVAPSAEELIRRLESQDAKGKEKTFEVAAAIGRLYFGQGRFADAANSYREALAKAQPVRDRYLAAARSATGAVPSATEAGCPNGAEATQVGLLKAAESMQKVAPLKALACLKSAMHGVVEVESLAGQALFLTGDSAGALSVYEQSLAIFESNLEARYARGALLLDLRGDDVASLTTAQADLSAVAAAQADTAKGRQAKRLAERAQAALTAGGLSKLAPMAKAPAPAAGPPPLSKETIDAFANAPKSAEQDARFAKLIADSETALAKGQYQGALDGFKQVMPYQPENARLRAGMAWSLVKLGKPMADRVWSVALQDPAALAALGDTLKAQGDAAGASALWAKLKASAPSFDLAGRQ
jgi:tetratricopeptide (TPR) repeat protein